MKDRINSFVICNGRNILNRIDWHYSGAKKYKLFFHYVDTVLSSDYKVCDNIFKNRYVKVQNQRIPFRFWIMWWQGMAEAPSLVKKNIKLIQELFGKNNVTIITKDNYKKYTSISPVLYKKVEAKTISLTMWSDIVRFNILNNYGGYWIDSTVALTTKFKEYFMELPSQPFFSICNKNGNYQNITLSRWTLWFIGGIPHLNLFEYLNNFYNSYFLKHNINVDYFLTDDAINHYYHKYPDLKKYCDQLKRDWQPYYLMNHFHDQFTLDMANKVNDQLKYSIQKLTYKFSDSEVKKDTVAWDILCLDSHFFR